MRESLWAKAGCLAWLFFTPAAVSSMPISGNPLPFHERNLPTEIAQEWFVAAPGNDVLEGAIFDPQGNLVFCDVTARKVQRLTPERQLSTLVELPDLNPGGLAWHKDGRLFIAALNLAEGKGAILAWSPETKALETIIPVESGYWPNDLVFDKAGGFYFSDFRGNATNPVGGIYYVSPDLNEVTPVIANLGQANGVALSPDEKVLWATEFAKNRLHRAELQDAVTIQPTGSSVPWYFSGPAPDSMRVDKNGNVYVAMYTQGRILIFNNKGIAIGQILLPDRENGRNLLSTSLALQPDGGNAFIVSSNADQEGSAMIFKANSLSHGQEADASAGRR